MKIIQSNVIISPDVFQKFRSDIFEIEIRINVERKLRKVESCAHEHRLMARELDGLETCDQPRRFYHF